jgi:hypothetical protein
MWYNIIAVKTKRKRLNKTADVRKENEMEEMTNEQFKIIIEAIIQIVKDNEKETAIKKIEALLNK